MQNRKTLIEYLHNLSAPLDNRYSNFQVVNCDEATGQFKDKMGSLSVVFKAQDHSCNKLVAVKFFDPEIDYVTQQYRYNGFKRECDLIQLVSSSRRTIKLVQPIQAITLTVRNPTTQQSLQIPAHYYVVDWIEDSLLDYFLYQDRFTIEQRINIFRSMVLAVAALHNRDIFHRDLKPDNFRITQDSNRSPLVVAIDYGTAVCKSTQKAGTQSDYSVPIGANAYAPIEAYCGITCIRNMGIYLDIYSLGCQLYELFNIDLFAKTLNSSPGYNDCFGFCINTMRSQGNMDEKTMLNRWHHVINLAKRPVLLPIIDEKGNSVPNQLSSRLNLLLNKLTALDYRERMTNTIEILRIIDSCLKILSNNKSDRIYRARKRKFKEVREMKIEQKQQKLEQYMIEKK